MICSPALLAAASAVWLWTAPLAGVPVKQGPPPLVCDTATFAVISRGHRALGAFWHGAVVLPEYFDAEGVHSQAVLAHEFTHYAQFLHHAPASEDEAYAMQARYESEHQ